MFTNITLITKLFELFLNRKTNQMTFKLSSPVIQLILQTVLICDYHRNSLFMISFGQSLVESL